MVKKYRQGEEGGETLLTDLSKVFYCLPHDLLVAKLYGYGFDLKSETLVHSYLTGRKQLVKTDHISSSWEEIFFGVPQGSILGPLLFKIFVYDLFDFMDDNVSIGSYADDTTPNISGSNIKEITETLQNNLLLCSQDSNLMV